jgi:CP family cyanate transporter-like MFS transporter
VADRPLLIVGFMLLALNMRPAISSVPPILTELQRTLPLSASSASALAAIPLLCFGLFAALASPLCRRFGSERVLFGAGVALLCGLCSRALFPRSLLFVGTVCLCGGIGVMNVVSTSIVKERFPTHTALILSVYSCALLLGSTIAAGATAAVYKASGSSITLALGLWALPVAVALLSWSPQLRRPSRPRTVAWITFGALRRNGVAWLVTAFWGLQALVVYATLSWLPAFFTSRGATSVRAGLLIGVLSIAGIPAALTTPRLLRHQASQRVLLVVAATLCLAGLLGAWLAPVEAAPLFMVLLGIGQGCTLPLGLLLMVERAGNESVAASVTAMAQGIGYLAAALGVFVVGLLHSVTGGWQLPGLLLVGVVVAEVVAGFAASLPRTIHPSSVIALVSKPEKP